MVQLIGIILVTCATVFVYHDVEAAAAEGGQINLRHWKLTSPVNSADTLSGQPDAIEIRYPISKSAPPYYVRGNGVITLTVPVGGATTRRSGYARSEFRQIDVTGQEISWTVDEGGEITAIVSVDALPRTRSGRPATIVIGQVEGSVDELCMLYYKDGALFFLNDRSGKSAKIQRFGLISKSGAAPRIPLGAKFTYTITVDESRIHVRAEFNGTIYSANDTIQPYWKGKPLYFKVGAYPQVAARARTRETMGSGAAVVSIYSLPRPRH